MRIEHTKLKSGVEAWEYAEDRVEQFRGKMIGHGLYAKVYKSNLRSNKDVVMKVVSGVKLKEDGYFDYLTSVIIKQPSNPLVPRIVSVETIQGSRKKDAGYIVMMERLLRFDKIPRIQVDEALEYYGLESVWDLDLDEADPQDIKEIIKRDRSGMMKPFVRALRRVQRRHCPDVHHGNVMWRKTGLKRMPYQLVVTDPVSSRSSD